MNDFDLESQPFAECHICDCQLDAPTGYNAGRKHFCGAECMGEYIDYRNEDWAQEGYDHDHDYIAD